MYRQALVAAVLLVSGQARAPVHSPAETDPSGIVRQYVAAQNEHDIERTLTLLADSVELRVGFSEAALRLSHEQFRAQLEKAFQSQPSARMQIVDVLTEGAVVVTKERGVGVQPETAAPGLCVYRVRNGRIDYLWVIPPTALSG